MDQALKITNVLADPTRYHIYQYISKKHGDVTVQEIADAFAVHPNVARLHLTKLEDVHMLVSDTQKTGKGGRPSRVYRVSTTVVQLQFPFRDYQTLSKIAIEALISLGDPGKQALFQVGQKFGHVAIQQHILQHTTELSFEDKINIAKEAFHTAGLSPEFKVNNETKQVFYQVYNCPFKELATTTHAICDMHGAFMEGVFQTLFTDIDLQRTDSMLHSCKSCNYQLLAQ
ncbi:helix-turn-helix domain-containing protein [Ectobacillus antri]|jgi:predicted ArsR family transcriptional regulator|uniref:Helix-turn-helix domain-containing protein n=1 Tax=Ectobacillus antri TaxID=2486280 RepID=A0ABT6H1W7_9BACI|nr:helix-turn-helix domain-containing protein [Ectobacillus antri]MDG4655544.1 helix-turn-helix domain-containing protein [Ectobacillus antri]MDG5753302.1 helix-turn-helix domain-containing protein [Ectobacillus antri]